MPGMMETVLNVGLNDASVRGLATVSGDERFAWDSYRRLVAMFGKTVLGIDGELFAEAINSLKRERGVSGDVDLTATDLEELVETFKRWFAGDRACLPAAPARAARPRDRRGLRLVEHRPGPDLPASRADPARPGHRGERVHDGLRQPRRRLGHRRVFHPRPGHTGSRASTATTCPTPRVEGRRRRHPQHADPGRPRRARPRIGEAAVRGDAPVGDPLPRPVRHRVHPSSAGNCGCCRPASASGRPRRRSGSPPSSSTSS